MGSQMHGRLALQARHGIESNAFNPSIMWMSLERYSTLAVYNQYSGKLSNEGWLCVTDGAM